MSEAIKIMPVEQCGQVGKCMGHPSSYESRVPGWGVKSPIAVAALALKELEAARAKDIEIHERNLPAIENNKAIAARIEALMTEVGMPRTYSERDTKSRSRYPKTITHNAGWIGDVQRNCRTFDGFDLATSTYERLKRDYLAYEKQAKEIAEKAAREEQRKKDAEIAQRKADMELAAMLLRYQLPIESSWEDVLEHLRGKDQRLDLAVAMQLTRGDWSEGPYRVKNALDRFTIVTDEDKEIANDVLSCLYDFEDGRVFRDTKWNYNALYATIQDKQVLNDCMIALSNSRD